MPLVPGALQAWVYGIGCEVAEAGVHLYYLGIASGTPVDEKKTTEGIVKKIIKGKLAHWANRFLTWPAKMILLRHVLAEIPLYQIMSVGLDGEGIIRGEDSEWAYLTRSLILRTIREGAYQLETCQWRMEDILLLTSVQKIKGSPTLTRMLCSWKKAKVVIRWNDSPLASGGHLL
ncbi:hypothetical protein R1sor_014092 [Riccia sorocarpa]|uniref:Uncharacterized protein n=1 Tax=Riccia sorocarpa TaxID=122646 RepID=A0ABD3H8E9_9MARC